MKETTSRRANVTVKPREGEDIAKTLRRFKRAVEKSGTATDMRSHAYFKKPSERRRDRVRKAMRRCRKREAGLT